MAVQQVVALWLIGSKLPRQSYFMLCMRILIRQVSTLLPVDINFIITKVFFPRMTLFSSCNTLCCDPQEVFCSVVVKMMEKRVKSRWVSMHICNETFGFVLTGDPSPLLERSDHRSPAAWIHPFLFGIYRSLFYFGCILSPLGHYMSGKQVFRVASQVREPLVYW